MLLELFVIVVPLVLSSLLDFLPNPILLESIFFILLFVSFCLNKTHLFFALGEEGIPPSIVVLVIFLFTDPIVESVSVLVLDINVIIVFNANHAIYNLFEKSIELKHDNVTGALNPRDDHLLVRVHIRLLQVVVFLPKVLILPSVINIRPSTIQIFFVTETNGEITRLYTNLFENSALQFLLQKLMVEFFHNRVFLVPFLNLLTTHILEIGLEVINQPGTLFEIYKSCLVPDDSNLLFIMLQSEVHNPLKNVFDLCDVDCGLLPLHKLALLILTIFLLLFLIKVVEVRLRFLNLIILDHLHSHVRVAINS